MWGRFDWMALILKRAFECSAVPIERLVHIVITARLQVKAQRVAFMAQRSWPWATDNFFFFFLQDDWLLLAEPHRLHGQAQIYPTASRRESEIELRFCNNRGKFCLAAFKRWAQAKRKKVISAPSPSPYLRLLRRSSHCSWTGERERERKSPPVNKRRSSQSCLQWKWQPVPDVAKAK